MNKRGVIPATLSEERQLDARLAEDRDVVQPSAEGFKDYKLLQDAVATSPNYTALGRQEAKDIDGQAALKAAAYADAHLTETAKFLVSKDGGLVAAEFGYGWEGVQASRELILEEANRKLKRDRLAGAADIVNGLRTARRKAFA
jgi:hypothetical protein